jgi:hypothetical protein
MKLLLHEVTWFRLDYLACYLSGQWSEAWIGLRTVIQVVHRCFHDEISSQISLNSAERELTL